MPPASKVEQTKQKSHTPSKVTHTRTTKEVTTKAVTGKEVTGGTVSPHIMYRNLYSLCLAHTEGRFGGYQREGFVSEGGFGGCVSNLIMSSQSVAQQNIHHLGPAYTARHIVYTLYIGITGNTASIYMYM